VRTFENWCALRGVQPIPAKPADVADFVSDCADLGIERVWQAVCEISRAHYVIGLADPTLGGWVSAAINDIAKIAPPRSWPKEQKIRFMSLPYDLQVYMVERETFRDNEVRRAQTEAAIVKQDLRQSDRRNLR
jgi:hypothetical protein